MPVERASGGTSLIDVLDRVLDKGIVIDAWLRVCLVGIDLLTIEARVTVASFETWLRYAAALGHPTPVTKTIKTIAAQGVQVEVADHLPATYRSSVTVERRRRRA
jgi:hypothetical protein